MRTSSLIAVAGWLSLLLPLSGCPWTQTATANGASLSDNQSPVAQIVQPGTNVSIAAGHAVEFAGDCTDPDGDSPLTHLWAYGGGAPDDFVQNPGAVTFGTPGTYGVTYRCTDPDGASDEAMLTVTVNGVPGDVVYVSAAAPPGGDGASWETAFQTVQQGADAAIAGQQVWVAEGWYTGPAAREPVLVMKDGVSVYGGFAGTEGDLSERPDPVLATVLSGDFNGDDDLAAQTLMICILYAEMAETSSDNSRHVVVMASEVVLDGVTVTSGRAQVDENVTGPSTYWDSYGGGILVIEKDGVTVRNSAIVNNCANTNGVGFRSGGAVHLSGSSATIDNVLVQNNASWVFDGTILASNSEISVSNSRVFENWSGHGTIRGYMSDISITNSIFLRNMAYYFGAGISTINSSLWVHGSEFSNFNIFMEGREIDITEIENLPEGSGRTAEIHNSLLYGPEDHHFEGEPYGSSVSAGFCPFAETWGFCSTNAGIAAWGPVKLVVNNTKLSKTQLPPGSGYASGLHIEGRVHPDFASRADVTIRNTSMTGTGYNASYFGMIYAANSDILLLNSSLQDNTRSLDSVVDFVQSSAHIASSSFHGNRSCSGCIIAAWGEGSLISISNSSFLNDVSSCWEGGGEAPYFCDDWQPVGLYTAISHSAINAEIPGTGNILLSADPFVRAASGELYLDPASPCVDAGSDGLADDPDSGFPAAGLDWRNLTTRMDGDPDTGTVDMGRHHDPAAVVVLTFGAGETELSWTTRNADRCRIGSSSGGFAYDVPPGDLDSGSTSHGEPAGTVFTIRCTGLPHPAVARATAP